MRYILVLIICPCWLLAFEDILEFRVSYCGFQNSTASDIYGNALGLEIENIFKMKKYSLWINFNYVSEKGSSLNVHNRTHLYLSTLSFGPKVFFPIKTSKVNFYLGAGLTGAYVHVKDDTDYLPSTTRKWSVGCVGKTGFLVNLHKSIFLDLFFDYYYQPTPTRKSSSLSQRYLNLGGYHTGVGMGYLF